MLCLPDRKIKSGLCNDRVCVKFCKLSIPSNTVTQLLFLFLNDKQMLSSFLQVFRLCLFFLIKKKQLLRLGIWWVIEEIINQCFVMLLKNTGAHFNKNHMC